MNPFSGRLKDGITPKRPRDGSSNNPKYATMVPVPQRGESSRGEPLQKKRRVEQSNKRRPAAKSMSPGELSCDPIDSFDNRSKIPNHKPHSFDIIPDGDATERMRARYSNPTPSSSRRAPRPSSSRPVEPHEIINVDDDDIPYAISPPEDSPLPIFPVGSTSSTAPAIRCPPKVHLVDKTSEDDAPWKPTKAKSPSRVLEMAHQYEQAHPVEAKNKPAVELLQSQRNQQTRGPTIPHYDLRQLQKPTRMADKMKGKNSFPPPGVKLDKIETKREETGRIRIACYHLGTLLVEEDSYLIFGPNFLHIMHDNKLRVICDNIRADIDQMTSTDPRKAYMEGDKHVNVVDLVTTERPNGRVTMKTPLADTHFMQGEPSARGHLILKFVLSRNEMSTFENFFSVLCRIKKVAYINANKDTWAMLTDGARRQQEEYVTGGDEPYIVEVAPPQASSSRRVGSLRSRTDEESSVPQALQTRPSRARNSGAAARMQPKQRDPSWDEDGGVVNVPPRSRRSMRQNAEAREPRRPNVDPDEVVLSFPYGVPGAVNVTNADVARLEPGEFLNDTILEFALKYFLLELQTRDPALGEQVHLFSSFFFKKLTEKRGDGLMEGYQSVRKWTNKFDLFAKSFIFVPINESLHWYMALIYRPDKVLKPPSVDEAPEARRQSLRSNRDVVAAESRAPTPPPTSKGEEVPPTPSPQRSPAPAEDEDMENVHQRKEYSPLFSHPHSDTMKEEREVSNQLFDESLDFEGQAEPGSTPSRHSSVVPDSLGDYSTTADVGRSPSADRYRQSGSPLTAIEDTTDDDADGDVTMRTLSDDDKEPMASQEDADMSQNMDAMHIDESSSSDPLLLQDSLKETAKDPSSVLDDDGESTLRQSSDRHERVMQKKPVVHELSDEETPKTGGIQPAQFYGSQPVRRTYGSKNAKSQKAKGKQRAEPEPSDDIEIQDGEAEPELLRRDQTLVITFDSLGSQHQSAVKKLNTYLGLEARDKKGVENVSDVKGKMASVPVQPNFCDCGIYLIHFFRTFLSDPNFYLRQICAERKKSRDHGERKKVWHEEEVGSMRQTLKEIIEEESAKYKKVKAEKDKEKEEQKKKQVAEAVDEESSESDIDIVEVNGPPPSASKARSQSKRGGAKPRPRS